MQRLRDKYEALAEEALAKVKFKDEFVVEFSLGIVPDARNNGVPTVGYWLQVALKHNLLLGKPPIVATYPIPSTNLSDIEIERVAKEVLEDCRQERDRMNAEGQQLPAGLVGKKL